MELLDTNFQGGTPTLGVVESLSTPRPVNGTVTLLSLEAFESPGPVAL